MNLCLPNRFGESYTEYNSRKALREQNALRKLSGFSVSEDKK